MAGTRTAPVVNGTFTYKEVSLRWIDFTGDLRTDTYQFDPAATNAEIETFAAAQVAGSNASLYDIKVNEVYSGTAAASNASEVVWENVTDNVVIQAKNATNASIRCYTPSPLESMFVENTDNIDVTDTEFAAILAAFVALLPAGYVAIGVRFTSRRQINQQVAL